MRAQLAIHWPSSSPLWSVAPREDSLAAELADGHYSRQTPGADGFLAAGRCVVLYHRAARGPATWGVVHNRDPIGTLRFRNTLFRNVSGTLSSDLIVAATLVTYDEWLRKYGALPEEPLRTEVDIEATAARRSKHHEPGWCYLCAGWTKVRDIPASHGRSAKVELEAPPP
jgi:hypothetical protein